MNPLVLDAARSLGEECGGVEKLQKLITKLRAGRDEPEKTFSECEPDLMLLACGVGLAVASEVLLNNKPGRRLDFTPAIYSEVEKCVEMVGGMDAVKKQIDQVAKVIDAGKEQGFVKYISASKAATKTDGAAVVMVRLVYSCLRFCYLVKNLTIHEQS